MTLELERLAALSMRVHYLESEVRSLRSIILEQEAQLSELMEKADVLNRDNRVT